MVKEMERSSQVQEEKPPVRWRREKQQEMERQREIWLVMMMEIERWWNSPTM
jgi:hypothetical protein